MYVGGVTSGEGGRGQADPLITHIPISRPPPDTGITWIIPLMFPCKTPLSPRGVSRGGIEAGFGKFG